MVFTPGSDLNLWPWPVTEVGMDISILYPLGFKTFSKFWSEKYDTIEDPTLRLKEIFNLIDEIGKMNLSQLEQMHLEMKGILEFNLANLNKLQ